jgi:hypothetical protein
MLLIEFIALIYCNRVHSELENNRENALYKFTELYAPGNTSGFVSMLFILKSDESMHLFFAFMHKIKHKKLKFAKYLSSRNRCIWPVL